MAEKLTPQQEMAVHNRGGKLLVSAAAGSGKTKVLIDRLLTYLMDPDDPANLDDFLIITYTQAAASELRGKIAAKLTQRISEQPQNRHLLQQLQRLHLSKISTVHSFCTDILRENAYQLDVPADFRVAEENECAELQIQALQMILDEAYADKSCSDDFYVLIDSQGAGRDDRSIPEIILKVYTNSRCHLNPDAWLEHCVTNLNGVSDVSDSDWGKYLIADLHMHLDGQISSYIRCAEKMEATGEMEKPATLFRETAAQLMSLRAMQRWDDISANATIDYGRLVFPKNCTNTDLIEQIKKVRETLKKKLTAKLKKFGDTSEQLLEDYKQTIAAERGLITLVRKFSTVYDKLKQGRRVLDFSDLEHKTLDLLLGKNRSAPTKLANELASRFREVMVDEYQDSNDVQDSIFRALTDQRQNCFMVGDVKQSIYQFRLADPTIFIEKYNHYLPAEAAQPGEGRKVLLSCNFRSSGDVIDAVNDVFGACMSPNVGGLYYGEDEALKEGVPHISLNDEAIELYAIDVEENAYPEEAAFVANRVMELLDGKHMIRDGEMLRPIKPNDIVILLRSPKSIGSWYIKALEKLGIRCATENSENLFHMEENEVLFSLLKVINNPLLDIPLAGVLLSRVFGFTTDELAKIRGAKKNGSLYSALTASNEPKAKEFIGVLQKLRLEAQRNSLSGLMMRILSITRIDSIYAAMTDGNARIENMQEFCRLITAYEANTNGGLSGLIDHLDLLEQSGKAVLADQNTGDAVSIMSIHKSKGLEFPVVFLCALSRDFNMMSLNAQVLCHKELGVGLPFVDINRRVQYPSIAKRAIAACLKAEMISEEMRVLYVAMTRAKDRLIMVYSDEKIKEKLEQLETNVHLMDRNMLVSSVSCPGAWILIASIINQSGKWRSCITKAPSANNASTPRVEEFVLTCETVDYLNAGLKFEYPYKDATVTPSKQTATQLKGRDKDQEAAENSGISSFEHHVWRKPSFIDSEVQGSSRGTAMHTVMQYIRFELCGSLDGVRHEIDRLVREGYITDLVAKEVSAEQIAKFFSCELGKRLIQKKDCILREFKFSLLSDNELHTDCNADDQILLQGVIDCAIVEPDGITVIDFKSDSVTDQTLPEAIERYSVQVKVYAKALAKIYKLPVKAAMLYFFQLNRPVSVL